MSKDEPRVTLFWLEQNVQESQTFENVLLTQSGTFPAFLILKKSERNKKKLYYLKFQLERGITPTQYSVPINSKNSNIFYFSQTKY